MILRNGNFLETKKKLQEKKMECTKNKKEKEKRNTTEDKEDEKLVKEIDKNRNANREGEMKLKRGRETRARNGNKGKEVGREKRKEEKKYVKCSEIISLEISLKHRISLFQSSLSTLINPSLSSFQFLSFSPRFSNSLLICTFFLNTSFFLLFFFFFFVVFFFLFFFSSYFFFFASFFLLIIFLLLILPVILLSFSAPFCIRYPQYPWHGSHFQGTKEKLGKTFQRVDTELMLTVFHSDFKTLWQCSTYLCRYTQVYLPMYLPIFYLKKSTLDLLSHYFKAPMYLGIFYFLHFFVRFFPPVESKSETT